MLILFSPTSSFAYSRPWRSLIRTSKMGEIELAGDSTKEDGLSLPESSRRQSFLSDV